MTARRLIQVASEELTEMAFNTGFDIEVANTPGDVRAYLRIGATTYWAAVEEVTC